MGGSDVVETGNPDKMEVISVVWKKQPEAIVEIVVALGTYIHNLGAAQLDQHLFSDDQVAAVASVVFFIYSWSEEYSLSFHMQRSCSLHPCLCHFKISLLQCGSTSYMYPGAEISKECSCPFAEQNVLL